MDSGEKQKMFNFLESGFAFWNKKKIEIRTLGLV